MWDDEEEVEVVSMGSIGREKVRIFEETESEKGYV